MEDQQVGAMLYGQGINIYIHVETFFQISDYSEGLHPTRL